MFLNNIHYILFLLSIFVYITICKKVCKVPTRHYEEINCKPVYNNIQDDCPSYYDCDQYYNNALKTDTCYFNSEIFQSNQKIMLNLTNAACLANCACSKQSIWGDFKCADIDCPEYMDDLDMNNCYYSYKHDQCCPADTKCAPFSDVQCEANGGTYREGQVFFSSELCMKCICQEGFSGLFKEPYCKKINCRIQLMNREIKSFCAPVYTKTNNCCPENWECDEDIDSMDEKKYLSFDRKKNCLFRNKLLKVGEKFNIVSEGKKIYSQCECQIPPLTSCTSVSVDE